MVDGTRTTNLALSTTLDEFVGNKVVSGVKKSRRATSDNIIAQIIASTAFQAAISGRICTPQEFGAVGNGVANDTTAMVAWAAACQSSGRQPYVPPGKYLCSAQLDFSSKGGAIRGAGENLSIIVFTGTGAGFKCYPSASSFGVFSIDQLGLQASGVVVAVGVDVRLPNDGAYSNNFRTGFRNVEMLGVSGGYFGVGIRERNVCYSERRRVKYWGSSEDAGAGGAYYAGIAFEATWKDGAVFSAAMSELQRLLEVGTTTQPGVGKLEVLRVF